MFKQLIEFITLTDVKAISYENRFSFKLTLYLTMFDVRIVRFLRLFRNGGEGKERKHGLNADNTLYAVASRRYTSFKCVRNC